MTQNEKIGLIKEWKKLVDCDAISEDEFSAMKAALLSEKPVASMDSIQKLKELKELDLTKEDYESVKNAILSNEEINVRVESINALKTALDNSVIDETEYKNYIDGIINGTSADTEKVIEVLTGYKHLLDDGLIEKEDYQRVKIDAKRSLSPVTPDAISQLKEYKDLLNDGVIDADEYKKCKEGILDGSIKAISANDSADEKNEKSSKTPQVHIPQVHIKKKPIMVILSVLVLIVVGILAVTKLGVGSAKTFELQQGKYTFTIPDRYNAEPINDLGNLILLSDKETGNTGFLSILTIEGSKSFTVDYKSQLINISIDQIGMTNVEKRVGMPTEFTGSLEGIQMEGKMDALYSYKAKEVALVYIMHKADSDYDFCQDLEDIVASAAVDGETGGYRIPEANTNSTQNTQNDYAPGSDWEKYDANKDGKISDDEFQNATGDYIDNYFEENGTNGDLNAYDYNGNGEMEDKEFQDAVNDWMDDNGY